MRSFPRLLCVLCVPLTVSAMLAADPMTLSLEQALDRTVDANLSLTLSREAVAQSLAQADVVRSGALPIVSATAQQRRARTVTVTSDTVTAFAPGNRYDGVLNGSAAIIDAVRWSALQSAHRGTEVARADYEAALQSVLAAVADAYFTHLRNLRRLDVLDANIARARSLLTLAENQLRAGSATQIDVTRAQAQLAQAEEARLQQETADYQSDSALKRALDFDPSVPITLVDFPFKRVDTDPRLAEDATLMARRAEHQRAVAAVEQARADVRTARYERLPTLGLAGQLGQAGKRIHDGPTKEQWSAGLLLSVPLFDGARASADQQLARSRLRIAEARLHDVERQIAAELGFATQDTRSRNAQIGVAEKNLELARDQLRLAQQRYQQGVADNREVVEAQTQLAVAEDGLVEAIFQYQLSRIELARVHGDVRRVLSERQP